MSGADEEWVKAAMTDDAMVVELLVHLHAAAAPPPSLKAAVALPLEWSVRQRRSNARPAVSVTNKMKNKQEEAQRASPTTPLSWSGATCLSGGSGGSGAAGAEEYLSNVTRSKVNGNNEKPTSKRSRKKKTLAELKDEENVLLKERRELKRELAALCTNLEKQRVSNEKLKRMKIEFAEPVIISVNNSSTSNKQKFVLPDLNMPFEEDEARPDVLCGVS